MVTDQQSSEHRARVQAFIADLEGALDGIVDKDLGPRELTCLHQRLAEVGKELEPHRVSFWK